MPSKYDKSTSEKVLAQTRYRQFVDGGLSSTSYSGGSYSFSSQVTYEDVPTRDWRHLLRENLDATTEADGSIFTGKVTSGGAKCVFTHPNFFPSIVTDVYDGTFSRPTGGVAEDFDPVLYAKGLAKFVEKARGVQHQFQAGVFLGEIHETIELLKRPLTLFRTLTKNYHSRVKKRLGSRNWTSNRRKARKLRKWLANEYLQYVFGVAPLVQDIDDAMSDLAELSVGRQPTAYVTAVVRSLKVTSDNSQTFLGQGSFWKSKYLLETTFKQSVRLRGSVSVLIPSFGWYGSDTLLVALSDFAPTLYELIPYSFLVDYFANIGDIINCMSFVSCSVRWCNSTQRSECYAESSDTLTYVPPGPNSFIVYSHSEKSTSALATNIKWKRRRVTNFVPSLSFTLPGFGNRKWLNMSALLAQCRSPFERSFK